jgi:hypothetical protein
MVTSKKKCDGFSEWNQAETTDLSNFHIVVSESISQCFDYGKRWIVGRALMKISHCHTFWLKHNYPSIFTMQSWMGGSGKVEACYAAYKKLLVNEVQRVLCNANVVVEWMYVSFLCVPV